VLAVGIAQRPAMIAQIAAEHEADQNNITGKNREEFIRRRVGVAFGSRIVVPGPERLVFLPLSAGSRAWAV
jgi:hypothetical protein